MWPRGLTTAERNRLLLKLVSLTIIVSSWACQKSRSWACKCFQTLTDRASPGASMLEHAREQRIRSDQLQRSDFPIVKQRFVAQAMSILRWSRQSLQLTGVPGGLNATSNQVFLQVASKQSSKGHDHGWNITTSGSRSCRKIDLKWFSFRLDLQV